MSRSIFVRQLIAATREDLWNACTTARGMSTWQADEVDGDATAAENVTLSWPGLNLSVDLEVEEIVPFERLVLGVGPSRLTMEFETGAIRLTHEGLRSNDEVTGMRSAWRCSLGVLAHALTTHPGRARQVRWFTRRAVTGPELCHFYFTNGPALAQWLTRSGTIGSEGDAVALQLMNGAGVHGRVLANVEERDVALTWQEQDASCLVLRTFPSGQEPGQRLLALCWSRWASEPFPQETAEYLDGALARLANLLNRRGTA